MYLDAREGNVYVLAEGNGTAVFLSYADYDNATWIVYWDSEYGENSDFTYRDQKISMEKFEDI